jgi:hypothetical protein
MIKFDHVQKPPLKKSATCSHLKVVQPLKMNDFFACCGRIDKRKESESSIASFTTPEYPKPVLCNSEPVLCNSDSNTDRKRQCGLGIAFKPNSRGAFVVKRIIAGGPADTSGSIQVVAH